MEADLLAKIISLTLKLKHKPTTALFLTFLTRGLYHPRILKYIASFFKANNILQYLQSINDIVNIDKFLDHHYILTLTLPSKVGSTLLSKHEQCILLGDDSNSNIIKHELPSGKIIGQIHTNDFLYDLKYSPNGLYLGVLSQCYNQICRASNNSVIHKIYCKVDGYLCFSEDNKDMFLVKKNKSIMVYSNIPEFSSSGRPFFRKDNSLPWGISRWGVPEELPPDGAYMYKMDSTDWYNRLKQRDFNGKYLAVGLQDNESRDRDDRNKCNLQIIDILTGRVMTNMIIDRIHHIYWSNDGKYIIIDYADIFTIYQVEYKDDSITLTGLHNIPTRSANDPTADYIHVLGLSANDRYLIFKRYDKILLCSFQTALQGKLNFKVEM